MGKLVPLILSTLIAVALSEQNNTTKEKEAAKGPVVELRFPKGGFGGGQSLKEAIEKEDSSEVEEFLEDDPFSYNGNGGGVYPGNEFSPGYNPVGPEYPFGTGAGGFDAFTARKAIDLELFPGRRIRFLDTVTNIGHSWNNFSSEFVCNSPGVYFFTFSACGERYRHFRITLKHNDIGVVSAYGDQNGYQMATNSVVLRLFLRDRVYLQLDEGGLYEVTTITGRAYNTFTGYRIF